MLLDAEAEIARLAKVAALELVLLDLEAALEDLCGLGASDGAVHADLLVPADAERAHGVAGLGEDGLLARELLEHLGGARQSVARLADRDVEAQLLEPQLLHRVLLRHLKKKGFFRFSRILLK